jgi:predicted N-formylglutamate amidohydrolase
MLDGSRQGPVSVVNPDGTSPFVLICDHASNRIPERYGTLGLTPAERLSHIAWDPGALAVCLELVDLLDAPVVASNISRLVVDCNRTDTAPDMMPAVSEVTVVPGNAAISDEERAFRIANFHAPFHAAATALLDARAARGQETILVAMHSFTPVYKGVSRPWEIGLIHGRDTKFTKALFDALAADAPSLTLGWNEPYKALDGVTYTLEHHGDGRGLNSTMIEIRHNEILEPAGVTQWAQRLARCLPKARGVLAGNG